MLKKNENVLHSLILPVLLLALIETKIDGT